MCATGARVWTGQMVWSGCLLDLLIILSLSVSISLSTVAFHQATCEKKKGWARACVVHQAPAAASMVYTERDIYTIPRVCTLASVRVVTTRSTVRGCVSQAFCPFAPLG
jgi:hypothetical protein